MPSLTERVSGKRMHRGPVCGVTLFLATLPEDDAVEMVDLLHDDRITLSVLVREITADHPGAPRYETWKRHKRGECTCG